MYTCIYIHTYMYTYTCIHVYTYIHISICIHIYVYVYVYIEQIELQAKLLNYFLGSNKSNINQSCRNQL